MQSYYVNKTLQHLFLHHNVSIGLMSEAWSDKIIRKTPHSSPSQLSYGMSCGILTLQSMSPCYNDTDCMCNADQILKSQNIPHISLSLLSYGLSTVIFVIKLAMSVQKNTTLLPILQCNYKAVVGGLFRHRNHKSHPIAHPHGWAMGCLLDPNFVINITVV